MIMYLTSLRVFMTMIRIIMNTMYAMHHNSNHICSWSGWDFNRFRSSLNSLSPAFSFILSSAVHSFFVLLGLIMFRLGWNLSIQCFQDLADLQCYMIVFLVKWYIWNIRILDSFCWIYFLSFARSLSGNQNLALDLGYVDILFIFVLTLFRNLL